MIYSGCVLHVGHCNQYRSVEVGSVLPGVFPVWSGQQYLS